jgi:GNAT superfamily N-acetyltransferase
MIRDATVNDLPALRALGERMHAESPVFSTAKFDPGKLERLAVSLIGMAGGIVLVATRDEKPVGFMAGLVAEHWITDAVTASDFALYVEPEARGGPTAVRLVRAFEDRARQWGATDLTPGVSAGINNPLAVKLYERLGYTQRGIGMWKPCATQH